MHGSRFSGIAGGFITGFSSVTGVGGASFLGGILSFIASRPFASANEVILWFGEKPWRAVNNNSIRRNSAIFGKMGITFVSIFVIKYPENYSFYTIASFNPFIILFIVFV